MAAGIRSARHGRRPRRGARRLRPAAGPYHPTTGGNRAHTAALHDVRPLRCAAGLPTPWPLRGAMGGRGSVAARATAMEGEGLCRREGHRVNGERGGRRCGRIWLAEAVEASRRRGVAGGGRARRRRMGAPARNEERGRRAERKATQARSGRCAAAEEARGAGRWWAQSRIWVRGRRIRRAEEAGREGAAARRRSWGRDLRRESWGGERRLGIYIKISRSGVWSKNIELMECG